MIWMHASVDSQIVDCSLANILLLSCLQGLSTSGIGRVEGMVCFVSIRASS